MTGSAITQLRAMMPLRPLTPQEAFQVAELQASKLLRLAEVNEAPTSESVITALPRLEVARVPLADSGSSQWVDGKWLISVNAYEGYVRNRFTLFHEFKHILDHPFIDRIYPTLVAMTHEQRRERVADYFAACTLAPKRILKRVWGQGVHDVHELAHLFQMSPQAMNYRLQQTGLTLPASRHATNHRDYIEAA